MKTPISLLVLLLISAGAFAQTSLRDEWEKMHQARNADVVGFMQERTTPNLTFIAGHDGSVQNKDWLMSLLKNQKSHKTDITNLTIQQAGDLAVATGVSTLNAEFLDGKKGIYKDAFTYTLRWIQDKWMITNIHHTKVDYK